MLSTDEENENITTTEKTFARCQSTYLYPEYRKHYRHTPTEVHVMIESLLLQCKGKERHKSYHFASIRVNGGRPVEVIWRTSWWKKKSKRTSDYSYGID